MCDNRKFKTFWVADYETELSNGWTVLVQDDATPEQFWLVVDAYFADNGIEVRATQAVEVDDNCEYVGSVFTR